MKAFQLRLNPGYPREVNCYFLWDGDHLYDPQFKGIISDGPLSTCGNRDCSHYQVDLSGVSKIEPDWFGTITPYLNPDKPLLKYDTSKRGIVSSIGGGLPFISFTTAAGTDTMLEEYYVSISGPQEVIAWKHLATKNSKGVVYSEYEETTRYYPRYPIALGIFYTEKSWSKIVDGKHTSQVSNGAISVNWFNGLTEMDLGQFDPKIFFKGSRWSYLQSLAFRKEKLKSLAELSTDCMQGFFGGVNNGIQYSLEMTQLSELAQPLVAAMHGNVSAKTLSSLYLSYEYGLRLSAKDTFSYVSQVARSRKANSPDYSRSSRDDYAVLRARDRVSFEDTDKMLSVTATRNLSVYYVRATDFIVKSMDVVRKAGFLPSLEIAWDFVPFTFVLDWFLPIGDAIKNFDLNGIYDNHEFIEHVCSDKFVYTVDLSKLYHIVGAGTLVVTAYTRRVSPSAPRPSFRWDDLNLKDRQIRNGAALLLQNWK